MYTREHTETHRAWTQVDTGTRVCKQSSFLLETVVHTRLTCEHTHRHLKRAAPNPHLNTWVPHAGPPGHAGLHAGPRTRSAETRAHILHVDARIHTPRGCRRAYPHPQNTTPPDSWAHPTIPAPAAYRPHAPDAGAAHWPLPRSPSVPPPAGPWGSPPTCPTVFPHHLRRHPFRVAPGPHQSPPPGGPPRAGCAPRGGSRLHNLEQVAAFPHFGGEGRNRGGGSGSGRQLERPPRVLAPAALRSAPRCRHRRPLPAPASGGPRRLPRGAVEIHATSRPGAAGAQPARSGNPRLPERGQRWHREEGESFLSGQVSKSQSPDNSVDPSDSNALSQL